MSVVAVGIIGGAAVIGGGLYASNQASKGADRAGRAKARSQAKLDSLEEDRQEIINPYSGVEDLSYLATDLSGKMSNPFANLGVATQAAEMEAEQADISLANALDTIRSSGASAGGATALAQAALKSKQGVSASIEAQEKANQDKAAAGERALQDRLVSEQQRLQGIQMSEAQRMQQADIMGQQFVFGATESREQDAIDRTYGEMMGAAQDQAQARADQTAAISGTIGGLGQFAGGLISDRRLKKNIKLIGVSASGLKIYSFEYINKSIGDGVFQGVMSDEIPKEAVIPSGIGFDLVDYSKIDVEFKKIA